MSKTALTRHFTCLVSDDLQFSPEYSGNPYSSQIRCYFDPFQGQQIVNEPLPSPVADWPTHWPDKLPVIMASIINLTSSGNLLRPDRN